MFRFLVILLVLSIAGCRTASVTNEYGVSVSQDVHGHYLPTYNTKVTIKY